jgi:hypothetical protein
MSRSNTVLCNGQSLNAIISLVCVLLCELVVANRLSETSHIYPDDETLCWLSSNGQLHSNKPKVRGTVALATLSGREPGCDGQLMSTHLSV